MHTFYVSNSGFTPAEISKVRHGLKLFEGTIWWGQDWISPKDAMHFQLNYPEGDKRNVAFAKKLREGYLGIWAGKPITSAGALTAGVLSYASNGAAVMRLQTGMNKVFPSYPGLPLDVDGDFGPRTELAVREFQRRVGLKVDGELGAQTAAALARYGIKL